tara:strand:+ start:1904 stop:2239 length:336 start_codon:yes stop_codon:yes gene_type:complete
MKKQKTISYGFLHHLFSVESNNAEIFLELEELPINLSIMKNGRSGIRLSIPIEEWRKITNDWASSEWCKNPEQDHRISQITPQQFEQFLKGFQARHPEMFNSECAPEIQPE